MRSRSEVLQDSAFFTAFVDKAIPAIAAFGGDDPLDCVCYGIGSIGDSKIAQFQFALLLAMRDKIEFRDVHLFEPVITNAEAEFIESRGIKIIAENENGRRKVERKTLFYMPHCEHTLYNSVLAANWSVLARISIVGNSFESYETNSIGTKLRDEHPHLADAVALATETPLAVFPPCEGAFNNTCLFRASSFASLHRGQVIEAPSRAVAVAAATAALPRRVARGAPAWKAPAASPSVAAKPDQPKAETAGSPTASAQAASAPRVHPGAVADLATEWGIKYTMRPGLSAARVLSFDNEVLVRPMMVSGLHSVSAIRRWKENFPPPTSIPVQEKALDDFSQDELGLPIKPLEAMTNAEWRKWLEYARSKRDQFKRERISEYEWREFLGIDRLPKRGSPIHPVHYSVREPTATGPFKVRGRLLNQVKTHDFAVGVGGVVAYLHGNNVPNDIQMSFEMSLGPRMSVDRNTTFDFYVLSAKHDHLGRPEVVLSMLPPRDNFENLGSEGDSLLGHFAIRGGKRGGRFGSSPGYNNNILGSQGRQGAAPSPLAGEISSLSSQLKNSAPRSNR
nr:hypothetical protein HK105_003657 [Polyrhizophydium stewartii]